MTRRLTIEHVATTIGHFSKNLPVSLTDPQVLEKADEMARAQQEYTSEEKRSADVKAQLKAKLTELDARRESLARIVGSREEYRSVECDLVADYHRGVATTVHLDTGEVIETRPLTETERQDQLPLER